ncbi:MAG: DUF362 domain-containing protein [Candidatus Eisenbacteria bacterium]
MTSRRGFLKRGLLLGGAAIVGAPVRSRIAAEGRAARSRIVVARDGHLDPLKGGLDTSRLARLLDRTMQTLFDTDDPVEPWRRVVRPGEVVGLKVNCLAGPRLSTRTELVQAVAERLRGAGVAEKDIVVWDRQNTDLEEGGYRIRHRGSGIRCFGNDLLGFGRDLEAFGSAGSLVCRTLTETVDAVINLPVLKDHGIAGVTMALKNLFGAVHNPNKYHMNAGDPYIPDVYMLPSIRSKVRLTIGDALLAQCEGGPPFMPSWAWPFGGLIAGTDPVALDTVAWGIIEEERARLGLPTLAEAGREPVYIATAADDRHRLGTNDPERIERVEA